MINIPSNSNLLIEEARKRLEWLKLCKIERQKWMQKCPSGKIHVVNSKTRTQFYLREDVKDKSGRYLPKSEESTVRMYLQKAYNEKALILLDKEIQCLERFLIDYGKMQNTLRDLYAGSPEQIRRRLKPIDVPDDIFVKQWESVEFEGKAIGECKSIWLTDKNEQVRSKTELNIANALTRRGIPYRYEAPLRLKSGFIIYPDFTVLDVKNRKEIYWEHRGMMDDREYAKNSVVRIRDYERDGIFLGDRLIITEETATVPLGSNDLERVINHFFS